jgi:hypothetical protein
MLGSPLDQRGRTFLSVLSFFFEVENATLLCDEMLQ